VGTRLVEALIAHSRAQGVYAIELWTAADGPGRRLYETLGFRKTEGPGAEYRNLSVPGGHLPDPDEIRMRLDVCDP
jgi:hypothetical protein